MWSYIGKNTNEFYVKKYIYRLSIERHVEGGKVLA